MASPAVSDSLTATHHPSAVKPQKIITLREQLGYAAGDTASVFFFKVFSSFLMFFYTDVLGVSAVVIGTMFWVTRIFDAVNDPLMGVICDRTKSKHGKFRPWLVWMVIPYALSGVAIFLVPDWEGPAKIVYIYVTYTLAMVFYTAINIPYGALMGVMTPNSDERTLLSSFRFYGAYFANLVVQGTILYLVVALGGSEDGKTATQSGYVWTMVLYAVAAAGCFLFTFYSTKERVQLPKGQEMNLVQDLKGLVRNKPWLAAIVIGITTILWIALRDAAILYYFRYYVVGAVTEGAEFAKLATIYNVIGTVGTLLGVALTGWFTKFFGCKKNAYIVLTVATALVAALYFFAGPGDVLYIYTIQFGISLMMGPLMPLFWSMIADTADYSEWKFGRRFTGLTFSAGTFAQKLGWAMGPAMAGYLLAYYGYQPNVQQTERAIEGLRLMMSLIPSAIGLVAAGLVFFYSIDGAMERQMDGDLRARREEA